MPALAEHKVKAERCLACYRETPAGHVETRLVLLFYCAVHLVEMVCAKLGDQPNPDHRQRHEYLQSKHRKIWKHYQPLHQIAWSARYDAREMWVSEKDVQEHYRRVRLSAVEKWAIEHVGEDGRLSAEPPTVETPRRTPDGAPVSES